MGLFTLSVDLKSAYAVETLSHIAEIVVSEGHQIACPEALWCLLGDIESGLNTATHCWPNITGITINMEPENEGWLSIAAHCERIAKKIRELAAMTDGELAGHHLNKG